MHVKFWPKTFIKVKNKKEEGEKQEVVKVQTVDNYLLMNTPPITAQSEQGTWATVEGVAQRQNKPCRMSFVERATFRAGNNKCVFFWEFHNLLLWYQIDIKFSPMFSWPFNAEFAETLLKLSSI